MSIEYSAKEESTLLSITKSNYNFACRKVYDIGHLCHFQDFYVGCQFMSIGVSFRNQFFIGGSGEKSRGRHVIGEGNINCGIRSIDVFVCLFACFFVYVAIAVAAFVFIVGV